MLSVVVQVLPAHLDWLEALAAGDDVFTTRFGIPVVDGWVGFPEALPLAVEGARERSEDEWGTHLFFDDVDGALVGFGGFKGEPRHGEVELGYAIAPSRRGRGIATAVVGVLVERARSAGINTVTAHTLGEENASTAVLRKNGFVRAGDVDDPGEGTVWRWELLVAAAGDRQHHD
jgi:RimJ/RimL family protein N-acetyltransferase